MNVSSVAVNVTPMLSNNDRSVTVLVPALNEQDNIGPAVENIIHALNNTIRDYEIIVVNDGSTDATRQVVNALSKMYPSLIALHNDRCMGLGFAYQRGIECASKTHYVYIPGDNTWPVDSLITLFENLGKSDVVTSFATNPEIRPWGRRIVSKGYTKVLNLLFGKNMKYYNGLTVYPIDFLRGSPISTYSFGFQAEALLNALFAGLSVLEIGLQIDERAASGSKAVRIGNVTRVATTVFRLFLNFRVRQRQVG